MSWKHWLVAALALASLPATVEVASAQAQVRVNAPGFRLWGRNPWFGNANVRRQLKLDDTQYTRLNEGYVQYWTPYNQTITTLPADLNEQERQRRMAEAYGTFNTNFGKTTTQVFTDPQIRNRYSQLNYQYQGYGAFNDPTLQEKLRLTDEQRQAFNRYNTEWQKQMDTYARDYATDRTRVEKEFPNTWKQYRENVNTTLTPEQRKTWNETIGEPYDFPADVYFDNSKDGEARKENRREDK